MKKEPEKLLNKIESPKDLRKIPLEDLPQLCNELRQFIINSLASNPGHFASSLGVVELTVALHYVFDTPYDRIVWDVGHQAAGHKILTGRRDLFYSYRHFHGLKPFPSPQESEYDTFTCGHASNSISAALGMAVAAHRHHEKRHVIAVIGDGSMSGGLAFEGLNNASAMPNDLLIILNDNNMSIDHSVGGMKHYLHQLHTSSGYNRLRYWASQHLLRIGWLNEEGKRKILRFNNSLKSVLTGQKNVFEGMDIRYFGPENGHDVIALVRTLQSIRDMKNLSAYQGVNRFNDADMLCTALHGKGKSSNDLCGGTGPGMTQDEYRTQFALWCMWSSPMALSFDPRSKYITDDDYAIMKSTELIALNQDRMGQQADLISEDNDLVIFAKDCENGDVALSVTNMSSTTKTAVFNFDAIPSLNADKTYAVRDLWERKDLGDATEKLTTRVRPHATKVFRLAEKTDTTAVKSLDSENGITVAPEKGKIVVSVPFVDGMKKRVLVCDMDGRIVKSLSSDSSKIDVPMPDGAYVVTVACNAQVIVRKVIV